MSGGRGVRGAAAMRVAVIGAFVLGAVTGCGGGGSSEPASSARASTTAPARAGAGDEAAADAKEGVTLDDPGAQPRQPLLLRISPGTTTRAELVSKVGLQMSIEGEDFPVGDVPATRTVLEQRVDSVDADGTSHYTLTVADVTVLPTRAAEDDVVSQSRAALAEMKGLHGTGSVDAHGGRQTASFDTSGVSDPNVRSTVESVASQLGNLSAPFPQAPVGTGARWTSKRRATINGITVNTTTGYTLRERTGDRYRLDVVQDAVAPPGAAAIPNLPAGAQASIKSFVLHSTGALDGDLTRQLPATSRATGGGDGTFTVAQGGQRATLVEHLTLDFTLGPA